ncbi:hypothetical protein CCHL11_02586 [Colletotrichum chlorophyti]|uniref:Uncharacterized protein n=1 Tax=Colletotrichum chlorophyti TaxID=708187 RepID=A0A1Q8S8M6_9PEZI|nr:hypothetical protein CCHL11_02586 [Colletotrichum chlorophyti]
MADEATSTSNQASTPSEEENWEDVSSSDDDYYEEGLSSPQELLLPHERLSPPQPSHPPKVRTHAHRIRLIHHSRDWDTQIYLLEDGKVLKERSSYLKLSQGYFVSNDFNQCTRHWHTYLRPQLETILGPGHPYLLRLTLPISPRQYELYEGPADSTHLDGLSQPFPQIEGRLTMERMKPIRPLAIRIIIHDIVDEDHRDEALRIPENYNLHPRVWLGCEETDEIRELLAVYPDLSQRPAYLNQLIKYIGRPDVLALARQMGTALAIIHYDLGRDARGVKFRLAYDAVYDRAVLWVCGLGNMEGIQFRDGGDGLVGDLGRIV